MQHQWFYSGFVPPQKHSRDRVATPAPCIVHLANGSIGPHGWEMLLAASLSVARFGPPPPLPPRPKQVTRYQAGVGTGINEKKSQPWSMAQVFGEWFRGSGEPPGVMMCPICLRPMRRWNEGGVLSNTAPRGRRWVTVDHIIHIEHEECCWCVWPMCNECNSSKGTADLQLWLPGRLEDLGRDVEQTRESVAKAWNVLFDDALEGQREKHDCTNAAPFRMSFGCAAGVHDWEWRARGRARCKRAFCGALGDWDLSTRQWRATGVTGEMCDECGLCPDECDCGW